jgi:hypothetical protein
VTGPDWQTLPDDSATTQTPHLKRLHVLARLALGPVRGAGRLWKRPAARTVRAQRQARARGHPPCWLTSMPPTIRG